MMLDFNDAPPLRVIDSAEWEARVDTLRNRLRQDGHAFVNEIFPRARMTAQEARIGSLQGEAGESLSISLTEGVWYDHATGEKGDLIDLWRMTTGVDFAKAVDDLEHWLGIATVGKKPAWLNPVRKLAETRHAEAAKEPRQTAPSLGPPVASYHYTSADGVLIAIVRRYNLPETDPETGKTKKTFRPFRADGSAGMPDPRPLYRLPSLANASRVVLVEGEATADALASIGHEATTQMGGSKADPAKTDWSPLAGKAVIVWEDNDKAGSGLTERVRPSLEAIGCTVTKVTIPAGKPPTWDAKDAVEEGADIAAIVATGEASPERTSSSGITATPFVWRDPRSIPPREWLYERHYIRKFVSGTIAPGGLGKSSLVLVEALSMTSGRALLGYAVKAPLRVWVWNGEDPQEEIDRRVLAACLHYDIGRDQIGGLFTDSGREQPIALVSESRDGMVIAEPLVDQLVATLRDRRIDVMVVDPFVSCHRVSENDNSKIDAVVKTWNRVAERANISIELVHHVRKVAGGSDITIDDSRGAGALKDGLRSSRVLNGMSEDEAARYNVEPEKIRSYFKIEVGKVNLVPATGRAVWRHLKSVDLGNATNDWPSDQVGVVTLWDPAAQDNSIPIADIYAAQVVVSNDEWRADQRSQKWVGRAVAEALGYSLDRRDHVSRVKAVTASWVAAGWLQVVSRKDENRRSRDFVEVGKWAEQ